MNGWAEDAFREAMDVLSRSRRNDLASDMLRIFKSINFEDLEIMRSSEADSIADRILEAESIAELTDCLRALVRAMKVGHCTLHIVRERVPETYSTKVLTTYPKDWVTTYIDRRYFSCDPVMRASKVRTQSFYWDALEYRGPVVETFWRDAAEHGVGSSGFTLPVTTEDGDVLALSISSTKDPLSFRETLSYHESDLCNLSIFLAEAFCRLASDRRPVSFNPTDDQLMVLRAVSMGMEDAELEIRDYLYGSYATLKRSICELFHTKTMAQAAVLAARVGLLDDAPLAKGDIMAASENGLDGGSASLNGPLRRLIRARSVLPTAGDGAERPSV